MPLSATLFRSVPPMKFYLWILPVLILNVAGLAILLSVVAGLGLWLSEGAQSGFIAFLSIGGVGIVSCTLLWFMHYATVAYSKLPEIVPPELGKSRRQIERESKSDSQTYVVVDD